MMYELEKSDSLVVPTKSANKTGLLVAEPIEGSGGIARKAEMLKVWVTHYNGARPQMALGPGVPDPPVEAALHAREIPDHLSAQAVVCARSVLGGLHQEYSLGPALA